MTRQRVKFALVANENSRASRLKKLWSGLNKKVREITILCDVKLCVIMFSPNNAEPMVWPSVEAARDLIGNLFALPEIVKKMKATTIESYMNEKIRKAQETLEKSRKKIMEREIDQLMVQIHGGRSIDDLDVNVINALLYFSRDKIMQLRKRVDSVEHLPLPDPPMHLFETQSEELRTTTNDVFVIGGGQDDERARNTDEGDKRIHIGTENQTCYLIDQWVFPSLEPLNPQIHQQIGMGLASYNEIQDPRSYLPFQGSYHPYQGSSSSGNSNLEMQPIVPPVMPFQGMAMSQPLQYPFDDVMSLEEQSNVNIGGSQFHWSNNSMPTNDGLRQDPPQPLPPPPNEATAGEGNAHATPFDPNRDWPGINDHHF